MKLRKVISGGQTGADRTGLECAKELGLETGGTVPKGCRTDEGTAPDLVTVFGCTESPDYGYQTRTRDNVRNSDVTVWFGVTTSPGFYCTRNAAKLYEKPLYMNPAIVVFDFICNTYGVMNVAGNRRRINPGVVDLVKGAFASRAHLRPSVSKVEDRPEEPS